MNLRDRIIKAYVEDPKFNRRQLAAELDCHYTYISDVLRDCKKAHHSKFKDMVSLAKSDLPADKIEEKQAAEICEEMDKISIETRGVDVRTPEGACEYCGVDLTKWRIVKKVVNFWDVTMKGKDDKPIVRRNWQVKVWLERIQETEIEKAMERLVKKIPSFKPRAFKPVAIKHSSESGNLGVIANMDAHIGKLAWGIETGQGDYDIPIASEHFDHVTDVNLSRVAMFNPEKIIYILGEDMMHYENLEGVTPKGRNSLDTDSRLAKLQDAAIDISVRNVVKCLEVAPVEVILVQGNHDQTSSLWLAKVLRAWFRDYQHVDVDCTPKLRKARLWGKTFIGFTHKIPPSKIFAQQAEYAVQFKEMWGQAEYRECLFGDQHKKHQWKTGSQITAGTMMFRQLTALSRIDYWHYENLFVDAVPGGEALVYNKDTGCIANFTEWTYHLNK